MVKSQVRVVGISGASNAGKTTVCEAFSRLDDKELYKIVCMDDYYWPVEDEHHEMTKDGSMANFDCMTAVDWNAFLTDLQEVLSNPPPSLKYLIVEGIFVLNYPKLAELMNSKIFLTLDFATMYDRRRKRVYCVPDSPNYFVDYVYPAYRMTYDELLLSSDSSQVKFIPGTLTKTEVFSQVWTIVHDNDSIPVPSLDKIYK